MDTAVSEMKPTLCSSEALLVSSVRATSKILVRAQGYIAGPKP